MSLRRLLFGTAAVTALAVATIVPATGASSAEAGGSAGTSPVRACETLLDVDLGANTTIESAVQDAGTATTPPSCRVQLFTTHPPADDRVTIWIYLPTESWNGRFLGVGGGGYTAGSPSQLIAPLTQGYAAGATDAGNPSGTSRTIGLNPDNTLNWTGQENFGHRGIHEMTVNGKALVQAYYGRSQDYAYFSGCSTGGRQGAMEAQKYPEDYDGITAGAPVFNYPELAIAQLWSQVVMLEEDNVLSACKLDAALAAVVEACDEAGDGVRDGVIGDPLACDYDFNALIGAVAPCGETITAEDVAILEKIRQGPKGAHGEFLWYGLAPGTPYTLTGSTVVNGELVGAPFGFIVLIIAYWLEQDPDWDWRTSTYASFEQHFRQAVALYDDVHGAGDPDIRAFADAGGKLLFWHGWADWGVFPEGTIDYYERVEDLMGPGKTQQSVRLFMAPGVDHCGGGAGGQPTQQLETLIRWVEEGKAPDVLPAVKTQGGQVVATRPICAYPFVAQYKGSGDPTAESRFRCVPGEQLTPEQDG